MPEITIMQNFGVLNPDGTISDVARQKLIDYHQQYSENGQLDLPFECTPKGKPNPYHNADLGNKEKYKAWHDRWIDGFYKTLVDALDKPASSTTFMLPIFDPTGVAAALNLPIPDLSFPAILGAFAMPIPACAAALDIKVDKLPDFTASLFKLIKVPPKLPGIPEIPVPVLPSGDLLFSPPLISLQGFNIAFFKALLPGVLLSFITDIAKPDFWISFTPAKLFEGACKAVQAAIPPPETSLPTEYLNNTSMITVAAADLIAARAANEIVGATTMLKILGQQRGYRKNQQPPTSLDQEANLNGLTKFLDGENGGEENTRFIFPNRNSWYGDQFTIDTINALAKHMRETPYTQGEYTSWTNKINIETRTYSLRDSTNAPLTLYIGNITLKEDKLFFKGENGPPAGWRFNHFSRTHAGSSFDCAYPMKIPPENAVDSNVGSRWLPGIADNATTIGDVQEEEITSISKGSPYLGGELTSKGYSSADQPYTVEGIPPKTLETAYKTAPATTSIEKQAAWNIPTADEIKTANENNKNGKVKSTIKGILPHDFAAMYEMGRWLFHDWLPMLKNDGRLLEWNSTQNNPQQLKTCPIQGILIGEKIFHIFSAWTNVYIKSGGKTGEGALNVPAAMYENLGWKNQHVSLIYGIHPNHEDHMHWKIKRSRHETRTSDGANVYFFRNEDEGRYDKTRDKPSNDGSDKTLPIFFRYEPRNIELGSEIAEEDKKMLATSTKKDATGKTIYYYDARI
jgi:hypothetical protein